MKFRNAGIPDGTKLRQQPIDPWPNNLGCVVATVRPEPEELANQLHIRFTKSHDQLDQLDAAIVELPSGQRVGLVRYQGCPSPGTEIWLEENTLKRTTFRRVLAGLSLTSDEILWKNPDIIYA